MNDQAVTHGVLRRPGPARALRRRIEAMSNKELLVEFGGVLNRKAYADEEEAQD